VIFFVHSTGILRRIGTKHEISVRKSHENPLEKNLSIVIRFVVMIVINKLMVIKNRCPGFNLRLQYECAYDRCDEDSHGLATQEKPSSMT
jgi:hypothetical protein